MRSFIKPLLLAGSLLPALRATAQVAEASPEPAPAPSAWKLAGSVQTGQAVPLSGAKVLAVNTQSGQRQLVITGRQGEFQLESLPADVPYLIEVVLKGYEPQVLGSLFVSPNRSLQLTFSLVPTRGGAVAALHVERPLMR